MASNCFGTIHNYQLANPAIVPQNTGEYQLPRIMDMKYTRKIRCDIKHLKNTNYMAIVYQHYTFIH